MDPPLLHLHTPFARGRWKAGVSSQLLWKVLPFLGGWTHFLVINHSLVSVKSTQDPPGNLCGGPLWSRFGVKGQASSVPASFYPPFPEAGQPENVDGVVFHFILVFFKSPETAGLTPLLLG